MERWFKEKLDPGSQKKYYQDMNRAKDWYKQAENDLLFEYFTQEQAAEAVGYAESFINIIGKEMDVASEDR